MYLKQYVGLLLLVVMALSVEAVTNAALRKRTGPFGPIESITGRGCCPNKNFACERFRQAHKITFGYITANDDDLAWCIPNRKIQKYVETRYGLGHVLQDFDAPCNAEEIKLVKTFSNTFGINLCKENGRCNQRNDIGC
ncbi:hypothetical protein DM01DRAFT_1380011, partial [Hesseltinella vesiculosa]